jgi:eukaryotic-like serine/threonine-protein kinase
LLLGRYALHEELARGGMATVHVGRLRGVAGFTRTVAIKRLHPQFARDPEFVAMLMDEARLAGQIHHPHVVPVVDVVALDGELLLVMDFVRGVSLSKLLTAERAHGGRLPPRLAVRIACDVLSGLHAAHEQVNEHGEPLGIVHRDVSPQNVMVGSDGSARVIDFGVAKAVRRVQSTRDGQVKGKICYMAPEQVRALEVDRRTDVYAVAAVLWEMLAGRRLYQAEDDAALIYQVLEARRPALRTLAAGLPAGLEAAIEKGLSLEPGDRFATAATMEEHLEAMLAPAAERDVARWVSERAGAMLERQAELVCSVEASVEPSPVRALGTPMRRESEDGPAGVAVATSESEPSTDTTSASAVDARVGMRASTALIGFLAIALVVSMVFIAVLAGRGGAAASAPSLMATSSEAPAAPAPSPSATWASASVPEASVSAPVLSPAEAEVRDRGGRGQPRGLPTEVVPPKKKKDYGF